MLDPSPHVNSRTQGPKTSLMPADAPTINEAAPGGDGSVALRLIATTQCQSAAMYSDLSTASVHA